MTKHLADHREASNGGRVKHFLRLARDRSETTWQRVWQRPLERTEDNRRLVEYLRIERGRSV